MHTLHAGGDHHACYLALTRALNLRGSSRYSVVVGALHAVCPLVLRTALKLVGLKRVRPVAGG